MNMVAFAMLNSYGCSQENYLDNESFNHDKKENLMSSYSQLMEVKNLDAKKIPMPNDALKEFINSYVLFEDNQYRITISDQNAAKLGISDYVYDEICDAIENGNDIITEIIEEYSSRSDIKYININSNLSVNNINTQVDNIIPLVKNRSETPIPLPSGILTSIGGEVVSTGCFAPIDMRAVYAKCYSYIALLPMHIVTVEAFGGVQIGTQFSNFGEVTVSLPASNTNCTISYCTTDANGGGRCVWKGVN